MKTHLLKSALNYAELHRKEHPEWKHYLHWSFIVHKSTIVAIGTNKAADPPVYYGYHSRSKIHSEVDAYRKFRKIYGVKELYSIINIRLNRRGQLKISKPCSVCMDWLMTTGCQEIIYSSSEGWQQNEI